MISRACSVVHADDHALLREAVARMLVDTQEFTVLASAGSADDAVDLVLLHRPGIVIFDVDMPGLSSFDAARSLVDLAPETRTVFLSGFWNDHYIRSALEVQAMAYITKAEPPRKLLAALRAVAQGRTYYSPEVRDRLVIGVRSIGLRNSTRLDQLTKREIETLRYLARGMSKKNAAVTMHLSVKTIDKHTTSMMRKLDIHDRVELARFAIREGLVEA